MENLRSVLEVDLRDIPTKPMDKEKEGFYLFVQGNVKEDALEAVQGVKKEAKRFKAEEKFHFPLTQKDLAMFVFCNLHEFNRNGKCNGITKNFFPRTAFYKQVNEITSISMFLCSEGKILEVAYDQNYNVPQPDPNTTFSSFEYRYK